VWTEPVLLAERYRVGALLGRGGMASVFGAFDERLGRKVAVKILLPEIAAQPDMHTRFNQEARLAAKLVHPNIVTVFDWGEEEGRPYLVMEHCDGTTLQQEIASGPRAPALVVSWADDVLAALEAAHGLGILHRDIKPSNVLVTPERAKVADFGIAKGTLAADAPDDLTATGLLLGTPAYLAPERRSGARATVQSDLFGVGAVMVEALSGRRFDAQLGVPPSVPVPLRPVLARALAPAPDERFPSAAAMRRELAAAARTEGPRPGPATTVPATAPLGVLTAPTGGTARTVPLQPAPDLRRDGARDRGPTIRGGPVWHRPAAWAALAALAVVGVVLVAVLSAGANHPPALAASTQPRDSNATALRHEAGVLSAGPFVGDDAVADALRTTAAQKPGPGRHASAQKDLALAQALVAGGGMSVGQFEHLESVLVGAGATIPTTTTTTPVPTSTTPTAPRPGGPGGPGGGPGPAPGHGHG